MTCPHSVLESVEFAEGDSFLDTPNTEHHFDCFYIVGSVVLRVVYLFHIPYQIYWCKDRKTLHISQRGGMLESKLYNDMSAIRHCKDSDNLWKSKSPDHSRTGRGAKHTSLYEVSHAGYEFAFLVHLVVFEV